MMPFLLDSARHGHMGFDGREDSEDMENEHIYQGHIGLPKGALYREGGQGIFPKSRDRRDPGGAR